MDGSVIEGVFVQGKASGGEVSKFNQASDLERGSDDWIKARVREAVQVLRAMALGPRDVPARLRAGWPDVVRSYADMISSEDLSHRQARRREVAGERNRVREIPPPDAIDRCDEVIGWLVMLSREQRLCLWGRAIGLSKPSLARKLGSKDYQGTLVWRRERQAIRRIQIELSKGKRPRPRAV